MPRSNLDPPDYRSGVGSSFRLLALVPCLRLAKGSRPYTATKSAIMAASTSSGSEVVRQATRSSSESTSCQRYGRRDGRLPRHFHNAGIPAVASKDRAGRYGLHQLCRCRPQRHRRPTRPGAGQDRPSDRAPESVQPDSAPGRSANQFRLAPPRRHRALQAPDRPGRRERIPRILP